MNLKGSMARRLCLSPPLRVWRSIGGSTVHQFAGIPVVREDEVGSLEELHKQVGMYVHAHTHE